MLLRRICEARMSRSALGVFFGYTYPDGNDYGRIYIRGAARTSVFPGLFLSDLEALVRNWVVSGLMLINVCFGLICSFVLSCKFHDQNVFYGM